MSQRARRTCSGKEMACAIEVIANTSVVDVGGEGRQGRVQ